MHVFITGAATGIGEATIDRWLEKDPAASFTIADKNETALAAVCKKLAARGVKAHGIAADITQLDKIPVIIKEAREKLGPIDILINNAGIMIVEDFSQMSWETGKRMLDINLTAPLRLIYEVLPEMIARKSGGIINIASMAGKALLPGCTWYGASKAGKGAFLIYQESLLIIRALWGLARGLAISSSAEQRHSGNPKTVDFVVHALQSTYPPVNA